MNFNFLENIGKSIEKTISKQKEKNNKIDGIDNEEIELANKLDAIEEYTIDRFEENMAVIENSKTGETKNVKKEKIPQNAKEGSIIKCINDKYFLDEEKTKIVEKEIKEKYKDLWE